MELSDTDRILLINQYALLKHAEPENAEHYDQLIQILSDGYSIFYSELNPSLCSEMSRDESKLVLDILMIYRFVENFRKSSPNNSELTGHEWRLSKGFDGNEEAKYYSFARFLITKYNRFTEQRQYERATDGFNTHWPVLEKYQRMISKWNGMGRRPLEFLKDILDVLDA